jgi:lysyl-tRNA synthetase class 2
MPSTVIRSFQYDDERCELRILFQSGVEYVYNDVPRSEYEDMRRACAKGEYFNEHIRDRYSYARVN